MCTESIHQLIISLDVQGSGRRKNPEKLILRKVIHDVISRAFGEAGVPVGVCRVEDRGDGALIIVPPHIPEVRMVGVWIEEVYQALRAHNGTAEGPRRIRMRIGVHAGQVHTDSHGVAGADVDLACRLADCDAARATLDTAHAAHLVVVVSDLLYGSVIDQGGRFIEPESYRKLPVRMKETDTTAWVSVPGYAIPPAPPEDRNPVSDQDDPDRGGRRNSADPEDDPGAPHGIWTGEIHGPTTIVGNGEFAGPFVVGTLNQGTGEKPR